MSDEDVVARSGQLDAEIAGSAAIHDLAQASHRNLRMIRLLAASIVLDIALSIVLGYETFQTYRLAAQANSIQRQAYTTCLASNDSRARELTLWNHVLDLTPTTSQTPEQQQRVADFGVYVAQLYAPRRC